MRLSEDTQGRVMGVRVGGSGRTGGPVGRRETAGERKYNNDKQILGRSGRCLVSGVSLHLVMSEDLV